MSKLIPWARFVRRKQLDIARLLSQFDNYQAFSYWFIRMGGQPPSETEVSQYFVNKELTVSEEPHVVLVPVVNIDDTKPNVSMKNTKVQLLEHAAAHDVVVSYYDTKTKILGQMNDSGKFIVLLPKSRSKK